MYYHTTYNYNWWKALKTITCLNFNILVTLLLPLKLGSACTFVQADKHDYWNLTRFWSLLFNDIQQNANLNYKGILKILLKVTYKNKQTSSVRGRSCINFCMLLSSSTSLYYPANNVLWLSLSYIQCSDNETDLKYKT